jgi:ankyrin repeat protein
MVRRRQTSLFTRWFGALLIAGQVVTWQLAVMAQQPASKSVEAPAPAPVKLDFDKKGPQPGDELPDLSLRTMKGEPQRLSDAWKGGPALLVTSSLTCPKSRSRWPELKTLVEKYDGKLNIVIVYVIEAHPVGSICPYKGIEDITPENERDGILRKQPKTEEDRLELAQEFKRLLRIQAPIYVDNVKDEAWKALGGAPNLALLVNDKGIVVARQGWFEGKATEAAIEKLLSAERGTLPGTPRVNGSPIRRTQLTKENEEALAAWMNANEVHRLDLLIRDDQHEKLKELLQKFPAAANQVIGSEQGHAYTATLLMEAVMNDDLEAVKLLLAHGADVNQRTDGQKTALQLAAGTGNFEVAQLLLAKGADPAIPPTGTSPLHEAAINGQYEIVKLLLAKGLRHDLYSAIAMGEIEMVQKGLKHDPSRALRPDGAGRMPMDYAVANRQLEIAQLLLTCGAPMVQEKWVTTPAPLHRAISQGHVEMVEWLLEAGSNPNTSVGRRGEYPDWTSALHMAVNRNNLDMVKLLLKYEVELKERNQFSQTALHVAASEGNAPIVATLLEAGDDPNAKQMGYELPCGSGEEEKPTYTTPLHFAVEGGKPEVIRLLLAAGASLDARTANGDTPLMQAVSQPRYVGPESDSAIPNVEALLQAGADVNAVNKQGVSVLDYAESEISSKDPPAVQEQQRIVALLKERGAKNGKPANPPMAER